MPEPDAQIEDSILHDIKQLLGQEWDDVTFDKDIIIHINTVFFELQQIGVGPDAGFSITNANDKWSAFITVDNNLAAVKSYIYIKVRFLFDPPSTGPLMQSLQAQADKLEWRLMVHTDPPVLSSYPGGIND